ncbi:hypothetical protein MIR68_000664 [Amoeboaphelidium protococcarum]|nr:hypothetical protein MIR68_000664 [Amoeboaphelidium protococcarum]
MSESINSSQKAVQIVFESQEVAGIPQLPLRVPTEVGPAGLNQVVKHLLQTADNNQSVQFQFLIDGTLLNTTLQSYILKNQLSLENTIKITVIYGLQSGGENGASEIVMDDWISRVQIVSKDLIVSTSFDGSLNVLSRGCDGNLRLKASAKDSQMAIKALCIHQVQDSTVSGDSEVLIAMGSLDRLVRIYAYNGSDLQLCGQIGPLSDSVESLAFSLDGISIAVGQFSGSVSIYEVPSTVEVSSENPSDDNSKKQRIDSMPITRPILNLDGHTGAVVSLKFMSGRNAGKIVSASIDNTIRIWDLEIQSAQQIINCDHSVLCADVHPMSGMLVAGCSNGDIRVWGQSSGDHDEFTQIVKMSRAHSSWVGSVKWNPSTQYNFASSSYDGSVKLWDVRSRSALSVFHSGSSAHVQTLGNLDNVDKVFSVDWNRGIMVSGGEDAVIRSKNISSGGGTAEVQSELINEQVNR